MTALQIANQEEFDAYGLELAAIKKEVALLKQKNVHDAF